MPYATSPDDVNVQVYEIYTGCPKKNETGFLIDISATNDRIFKSFFSPENPYANFEHKTISVQFKGTEIFTKQNGVLKHIDLFLSSS